MVAAHYHPVHWLQGDNLWLQDPLMNDVSSARARPLAVDITSNESFAVSLKT